MVADAHELNERIACNWKIARKQDGLTQDDLARRMGIRRNEVNSYENDRRHITQNVLVSVARALNRDPSWFTIDHTPDA